MRNLEQYRQMHMAGYFPGHSTKKWAADIGALIAQHGAKTLLDYGSGKGMQYSEQKLHEGWGVEKPTLYDPAVKGIDVLPSPLRPFDGVICCDVLEHLEGKDVTDAIFDVLIRAEKFAFFSISTKKAKKTLPDGRNAHLTINPREWWEAMFASAENREYSLGTECEVVLRFDGD